MIVCAVMQFKVNKLLSLLNTINGYTRHCIKRNMNQILMDFRVFH